MERATTSTISGSDRRRRRRTPRTGARRAVVGRSGRTGCLRREERPTLQSADGSHAYGLGLPLLVSTWIPWAPCRPSRFGAPEDLLKEPRCQSTFWDWSTGGANRGPRCRQRPGGPTTQAEVLMEPEELKRRREALRYTKAPPQPQ